MKLDQIKVGSLLTFPIADPVEDFTHKTIINAPSTMELIVVSKRLNEYGLIGSLNFLKIEKKKNRIFLVKHKFDCQQLKSFLDKNIENKQLRHEFELYINSLKHNTFFILSPLDDTSIECFVSDAYLGGYYVNTKIIT